MSTQVIMPLQNNMTPRTGEISSLVTNSIWPKTPQPNKFKQNANKADKNSNKKRRHNSEQQLKQTTIDHKTAAPSTPICKAAPQPNQSPFYAGAKFNDAPAVAFLPRPPTHWIHSNDLNGLNNLSDLNNNLNIISSAIASPKVEPTTEAPEKISSKKKETSQKQSNQNQTATPSSKYYGNDKKQRFESGPSPPQQQYNYFRNTRRNTPQCQIKCKTTRYSSFSRQTNFQKIAAVN